MKLPLEEERLISLLIIQEDIEAIYSLLSSERDPVFSLEILPYYALFINECQNYMGINEIPSDIAVSDIERTITFFAESVEAPVVKGQILGQVTLSYNGVVYGTVDLLADEDVSESRLLVFQKEALEFVDSTQFKLGVAAVGAVIVLIILLSLSVGKRRRRRNDSNRRGGYRGRRR